MSWQDEKPEEKEIREKLQKLLKDITPKGTRIVVNESTFIHVRLTCDGADAMMAYFCQSGPGHDGLCWCQKVGDFMKKYESRPDHRCDMKYVDLESKKEMSCTLPKFHNNQKNGRSIRDNHGHATYDEHGYNVLGYERDE